MSCVLYNQHVKHLVNICLLLALSSGGVFGASGAQIPGTRHFMYLSNQRIVTCEVLDGERAILNYINLGESFEVVQAPMLLLQATDGRYYRGHVFLAEDPKDPAERYRVKEVLRPREFKGYTVHGSFAFTSPLQKAFLRVGGRILELEPLSADDFNGAGQNIERLDLTTENTKAAIVLAGFNRGYGVMHSGGKPEFDQLDEHFPSLELLPPVLLSAPLPLLPPSKRDLPQPVEVRVSATVSKAGGVFDVEVTQGIDPDLDEAAVNMVRNRWRFLPAISNSEIANATLTLKVRFRSGD
jgi:TonB family protein